VQTTLLGLAVAIILALVTALVGPLFVDWNSYRAEFETNASRLTGLDFRVTGAIDARLLPTPTIVLQGVEFGRPDEGTKVRARLLRIEFALGALARGEWRIADARLEGPELAAGLDGSGRLAWPVPKLGFDLEGVSIARLRIQDGRATLADAASNGDVVLDKLEFTGEVRTLVGPIKGEGSFVIAGQRYPYRLASSRIGSDGSAKVRFTVDPIDQPLAAEADVSLWVERPRAPNRSSSNPGESRAASRETAPPPHWSKSNSNTGRTTGQSSSKAAPGRGSGAIRSSTARCRHRRSMSTVCWRCPSRCAGIRSPPSKRWPNPCWQHRGCQ